MNSRSSFQGFFVFPNLLKLSHYCARRGSTTDCIFNYLTCVEATVSSICRVQSQNWNSFPICIDWCLMNGNFPVEKAILFQIIHEAKGKSDVQRECALYFSLRNYFLIEPLPHARNLPSSGVARALLWGTVLFSITESVLIEMGNFLRKNFDDAFVNRDILRIFFDFRGNDSMKLRFCWIRDQN